MTTESSEYDVIVVGASIAGCTAATLYARAGRRVALLEAHRDPEMYKRLCTHFIQSSATPVIQRLGLDRELDAAGAVHNRGQFWTSSGLTREPEQMRGCPPYGYSVRREVLDPMLRRMAAAEKGVDLVLGAKVRAVMRDGSGRLCGVTATTDGEERTFTSRLVVGADGKTSTVAEQAGLEAELLPNNRFGYFAHYRGIDVPGWPAGGLWMRDNGDVAYVGVGADVDPDALLGAGVPAA